MSVCLIFSSHLQQTEKALKLVSYCGNCVYIVFYDGGAAYYHLSEIKSFLDQWPNPNRFLQGIKEDISKRHVVAGMRSLGIIDKLITGPFWRLLNDKKTF